MIRRTSQPRLGSWCRFKRLFDLPVITHSQEGFNFLGHTVRKYGDKLLTKPRKSNVKALLAKARECIQSCLAVQTEVLIRKLNPILRGWANYYQHAAAKRTFSRVDDQIYRALWR